MRRNVWAVGDRTISGEVGRILAVGDLTICDADARSGYIVGDMNFSDSMVKKLRAVGDINADRCTFGDVKLTGDIAMKGVCKADCLAITGTLNTEYLECRVLRNSAVSDKCKVNGKKPVNEFGGTIKADTLESFYPFRIKPGQEYRTIVSGKTLYFDGELECERFYGFAPVDMEGINAELVVLRPSEESRISHIMGSRIRIESGWKPDREFKAVPKTMSASDFLKKAAPVSMMRVRQIEGDSIRLDHVRADIVSGDEIWVGDLCVIDRLEYRAAVHISPKAIVHEQVKLE